MHKLTLRLCCLVLLLPACFQSASAQDKVYMPFFEVINLSPDYQYSASRLLKSYMDERGRFMLILPDKPEGLYPVESADKIRAKAESLGARYYIVGDLNRVGEVVVVTMIMYNTSDGTKYWSDKMRADNPDQLDPILQKLALNMGTMNKAEPTSTTTSYDQVDAKYSFGVSIGGAFLFSGVADPIPGFGVFGTYDAPNIIMEIRGQGYFSKSADILVGSLEAYYPFKNEKTTPFLGGGLGMGFTNVPVPSGDNEDAGLMLLVGGGYFFNRNSNASLRLSGNLFSGLYSGGEDTGLMLRMEMLFAR